jgi:hypothetical protein
MLLLIPIFVSGLDNGLARTPHMRWMAWEQLHGQDGKVNESMFTIIIDHLDSDGWVDSGYEYMSIEDCWMGPGRDANGELYADT